MDTIRETPEVDEYTAKMDRMLTNLKKVSKHENELKHHKMMVWISVGTIISIILLIILFNSSFSGFEGLKFLAR